MFRFPSPSPLLLLRDTKTTRSSRRKPFFIFHQQLSRARHYRHRPMVSCWDVTQQTCYMTQCAGFLVRKDLKRLVQQLEDVQKMELGLEPTLSVQVGLLLTCKYYL